VIHVAAAAHLRSGGSLSAWVDSSSLVGFVADKGNDHAVEVEEEHDEMEAELDEGFLKLLLAACRPSRKAAQVLTFLWTLSFLKISVASRRCWFSKILCLVSIRVYGKRVCRTDFFAFHASRGRFRIRAIQYPLTRNRMVMKAWTAASGTM
jgi:hypothetical protein